MKFYFDPETRKLSLSPVREVIFSKNEVGRILPKSQANLKNVKTEASNRARELADYFDDLVNMSGKGRQLLKALSETSDSIRLARRDVSEANNALQKAKRCLARCNGTVDRGIADVVTDYSAFMRGCVDSAKQGRNYQTLLSEPANISLEALKIARNDYVKATTHLEDRKNTLMRREKQFCKCRDEFLNCRATAESLMRKLTERIDTINRGNYRPLVEEKLRGKRETVGGYQQKAEACVQWFCSQRVVELSAI